jgi:hypothetical protein
VEEAWRLGVRVSLYFAEATANGRLSLNNAYKRNDEIVLLALGDVKYEVLSYLNKRKDRNTQA